MTVDQQVFRIVAEVLGMPASELDAHTPLRDWMQLTLINDETCMALNINIGTQTASDCRTLGDYLALVQQVSGVLP